MALFAVDSHTVCCVSAARQNVTFMLPNPVSAVDHIRVVTTSDGDVFVTEKRKTPCVEYIARGTQRVTADAMFQTILSVILSVLSADNLFLVYSCTPERISFSPLPVCSDLFS